MSFRMPMDGKLSRVMVHTLLALSVWPLGSTATSPVWAEEVAFPVESNLRAGVAKVDITPETPLRVTGHVREVTGVRDPIRAAVLLLDDGKTRAAIVTLDLIGAWEPMVEAIRANLHRETGIAEDHILVAASHNHSGPSFRDHPEWAEQALDEITRAAKEAAGDMRPVSLGYGEDEIDFGINRRQIIHGKAVVRLNSEGPNDPRVRVLRFDDGRTLTPLAVMMHAVCHPCFFTWGDNFSPPYPQGFPKVSADFPGEAQAFVEQVYAGETQSLFLQGCAGDIRPNLPGYPYRCADEADIQWAGRSLGGAVVRTLAREAIRERLAQREKVYPLRCVTTKLQLPGKEGLVRAELMALKIGPYLLLTMPGEPMVEFGFELERRIADRAIPIVVGYANGNIGYICTAESYESGGYEPSVSKLAPEAETILLDELEQLADAVIGDVFETFSKHPPKR
jgi:neutral ceramidase